MKISGIRSFGGEAGDEQDITFSAPVSLFLGQNGCGKTTIIEAIKYATTGDLPAGTRSGQGFIYDPQMAQKSESRGQIKLKLNDIKGKPLTIQKIAKVTQTPSTLKFQIIDSTITRDHQPVSNRCIDVHNEVCRSMGVSKAILNNVIFCHQEDSYWPLEEPKKLKERFDSIFDSVKYNKCVEKVLKVRKKKAENLKLLKNEVDHKEMNKRQAEQKRDQLREKEERHEEIENRIKDILNAIEPLQTNLEEICILERDTRKIEIEAQHLKTEIKTNKDQQSDILNTIKEIECSDDELENKIASFEADTVKTQEQINNLEQEKNSIEDKEDKLRNDMQKEQLSLGRLQQEVKQNKLQIEEQDKLIYSTINDFNVEVPQNTSTSEKIKTLEQKLVGYEKEFNEFEKNNEENEKRLQDNIDKCRTKCVELTQEIESKTKHLKELNSEKQQTTQKLNQLSTCDDQLLNIKNRMARIENDIKCIESQVDVNKLKTEIDEAKNKYKTVEDELQKLDKEIQVLQNNASLQTELDLQKENLSKKQTDVKKLNYKHDTDFEHIFTDGIPDNNLKLAVDKYLKKQIEITNEKTLQINNKEKRVTKLETTLSTQKDKLKQMKKQYVEDKAEIEKYFQEKTYEQVEEDISKTINDLQTQKGIFSNSIQMYSKFIDSFKEEQPCCPVCMRDVKEKRESTKIINEIKKKIKDFPNLAKQTEASLKEELNKQSKILQLKPVYFKVKEMEETDLPSLKKQVSEMEKEFEDETKEVDQLKRELAEPKRNQEKASNVLSDAALIDQYKIEIKTLQNEIATLSAKLPDMLSSRNIQDAFYEQENLKASSNDTRKKIDSLTEKLMKHTDRLQNLRDQKNDLKSKELNITQELQGKEQLEARRTEIIEKIDKYNSDLQGMKSKIEPMKKDLKESMKIKEDTKREYKIKRDKLQSSIKKFEAVLKDIKNLNDSIVRFVERQIDDKIKKISMSLQKYEQELSSCSGTKNSITKSIEGLKDQIVNKKSYYRELLDNKKLRKKRSEFKVLTEKYKKLEKQLEEHDVIKLLREKQLLERKISDFNNELSQKRGQKSELAKSIAEAKKELAQPMYANAAKDYKDKFLDYKILEQVIADLAVYAKALDWSMVQYHKEQMIYINETIRDLWRAIYRGNDIDYIEIKTEMETTKASTEKRRVYQYRLVQVKNDVELEMRGRCSAGQKVLASLVIRIALADTFSTKCGILALDEPTTNLDKENISSLCDALCELINRRKDQENFQLLIITHDEEFIEKLSRAVLIEYYNFVSRNEEGKSTVVRKAASF